MKPGFMLATVLLSLIAVGYLLRLTFAIPITIGDFAIPVWISAVGYLLLAAAAARPWREEAAGEDRGE
jgi:hypothetical protein